MRIDGTEHLTHSAKKVFETLRDRTQDLLGRMPNVEGMQVLSRDEKPPEVHLYNKWQGANREVPSILRPFIKKDLLAWFDRAVWNEERLDCTWKLEAVCFTCTGRTVIAPKGEGSVFELEGDLRVDPARVPGVPTFLARKLQGPLEKFIAEALRPNLTTIARAVQQHLDEKR
jgi:hypothetical protein